MLLALLTFTKAFDGVRLFYFSAPTYTPFLPIHPEFVVTSSAGTGFSLLSVFRFCGKIMKKAGAEYRCDISATRLSRGDPIGFPPHLYKWFSIVVYQKYESINRLGLTYLFIDVPPNQIRRRLLGSITNCAD